MAAGVNTLNKEILVVALKNSYCCTALKTSRVVSTVSSRLTHSMCALEMF